MKRVPLSSGKSALVDDAYFPSISRFKWTAQKGRAGTYYAYRFDYSGGKRRKIYMHRELYGVAEGERVDHVDGDGLNNRMSNLRLCTNVENMRNMRRGRGRSKYKGVSWYERDKRWRSYIVVDAKQIHLGYFDDEMEAAEAYDAAAKDYFGVFAKINMPERGKHP